MRFTKYIYPNENTKRLRNIDPFDFVSVVNQTKYPLYFKSGSVERVTSDNYDYVVKPFEKVNLLGGNVEYTFNFILDNVSIIDNLNNAIVMGAINEIPPKFIQKFDVPLIPNDTRVLYSSGTASPIFSFRNVYTTGKTEYAKISYCVVQWNVGGGLNVGVYLNIVRNITGTIGNILRVYGDTRRNIRIDTWVPPDHLINFQIVNISGSSYVLELFTTVELYNN